MFRKLFVVTLLFVCSSCALMFNDKQAPVAITSNPPGASIIIEGRNYGTTPALLSLEPRPYKVSLLKEGYGSASFNMAVWQGMEPGGDGKRCLADMIGFIFIATFYSAYFSDECKTFKEEQYNIEIPYTASNYGRRPLNHNRQPFNNQRDDQRPRGIRSGQESYNNSYDENDLFIRQGYGRSPRLPVHSIER